MPNFVSSFISSSVHYFSNLFRGVLGQSGVSLGAEITSFVTTDVGKLALDAVTYAATLPDKTQVERRDAAKDKLVEDAKAAGKDLTKLALGNLNLFVELAFAAFQAGITT